MSTSITRPRTEAKPKTERPKVYKVILLNDDYTPREFVVMVLRAVFRMTTDQALGVMLTAHKRGVCVVAVYTREIAETKATQAIDMAAARGLPAHVHHRAGGVGTGSAGGVSPRRGA